MAKVSPDVRARLEGAGRWKDFNLFRENAVRGGMRPAEALKAALREFLPEGEAGDCRDGGGSACSVVPPVASVAPPPSRFDVRSLAGRRCSKSRAMDWVMVSLAMDPGDVVLSDAPSVEAWAIYVHCRASPSLREELLVKALVRQIPNGTRDDDVGEDGRFDGQAEYDLLGAIGEAEG